MGGLNFPEILNVPEMQNGKENGKASGHSPKCINRHKAFTSKDCRHFPRFPKVPVSGCSGFSRDSRPPYIKGGLREREAGGLNHV